VLLVESTYGNREHKTLEQTLDELAHALDDTLRSRKGNVIIPAFAVGRTQEVLYLITQLCREGRVPDHDLYVDSPMALAATKITAKYSDWRPQPDGGPRIRFTEDLADSMKINAVRAGAVIVSASGMCEGGRIKHHLRHNIARPECAIVFVGFQAAGTLGRRIVDGASTVRLFGEEHEVKARVFTIGGLSAHADRAALIGWLGRFRRPPRNTWVVHGEPLSAHALRDAIAERLGWQAAVPAPHQAVEL
jgi:metallo-beta-lactamase family protein